MTPRPRGRYFYDFPYKFFSQPLIFLSARSAPRRLAQANRSLRSETTRGDCETPCTKLAGKKPRAAQGTKGANYNTIVGASRHRLKPTAHSLGTHVALSRSPQMRNLTSHICPSHVLASNVAPSRSLQMRLLLPFLPLPMRRLLQPKR